MSDLVFKFVDMVDDRVIYQCSLCVSELPASSPPHKTVTTGLFHWDDIEKHAHIHHEILRYTIDSYRPIDPELPWFRKRGQFKAIHFTGGAQSATPIINWILELGGTASWHENRADVLPEGIRYEVPNHQGRIHGILRVGEWLVRNLDTGNFEIIKSSVFDSEYEVIPEED